MATTIVSRTGSIDTVGIRTEGSSSTATTEGGSPILIINGGNATDDFSFIKVRGGNAASDYSDCVFNGGGA